MEKTSFITEWGTYYYRVMPFGLKNVRATYQRAATTLFHDIMHRDVEVYVDDMIVKYRDRADHLAALQRFFKRIRCFKLRLNPKKCTFGVTSRKLLGHIVSEWCHAPDPRLGGQRGRAKLYWTGTIYLFFQTLVYPSLITK